MNRNIEKNRRDLRDFATDGHASRGVVVAFVVAALIAGIVMYALFQR